MIAIDSWQSSIDYFYGDNNNIIYRQYTHFLLNALQTLAMCLYIKFYLLYCQVPIQCHGGANISMIGFASINAQ